MRLDVGQILLLEDEPFIAIDLEEMLAAAGVRSVVSLDSGAEAESWLASNRADIAIIDPRLKDGVCSDVATILTEKRIPFLVHSGDVQSVMEPGSSFATGAWISKPCLPAEMLDAIHTMLANTPIPPGAA